MKSWSPSTKAYMKNVSLSGRPKAKVSRLRSPDALRAQPWGRSVGCFLQIANSSTTLHGRGGGEKASFSPFQQNIRNGDVSQLILFLIVESLKAVYSFSKLGWLCKLTWPVSSENRSVRGRETYFWFIDNLMLPSFKLSESAAKEDEICYDNRYNTLYVELSLKMQTTAFPMKLQNSFSLLAGQLVRFQVLNSLGGGLFWLYFPLVFYNI